MLMNLTIADIRELIANGTNATTSGTKKYGAAVVVLDRGFVYYSPDVSFADDVLTMTDARNIRVWGTTAGLAEIITGGPTKATKIDAAATAHAPWRAVISIHPTAAEKWR